MAKATYTGQGRGLDEPGSNTGTSGSGTGLLKTGKAANAWYKKHKKDQPAADTNTPDNSNNDTSQPQPAKKPAAQPADHKNIFQQAISGVEDVFDANTDADKKKRVVAGQPVEYQDQQAQKKQQAEDFKTKAQPSFDRGNSLDFTPDDIEARRAHYSASGVNIDQLMTDKAAYQEFTKQLGGDPDKSKAANEKLIQLTLAKKIPAGAARYQQEAKVAAKAEQGFQRDMTAQAGADSTAQQVERNFISGAAQPLAALPSNLEAYGGAILQAVGPDGSKVDKAGATLTKKSNVDANDLAGKMVASGYGGSAADNPAVAGIASGAGSLLTSVIAAKGTGMTSVPAAIFGVNSAGDTLRASKQAGQKDPQSLVLGTAAGVLQSGLEKLGLDKFLGATGGPFKEAVVRMLTEGTQEAAQSLAQSGVNAVYSHVDLQDAIQQAVDSFGIGALVGGGASLPLSISESLQKRGVPSHVALATGMDVQDRIHAVLADAKANTNTGGTSTEKPAETAPNDAAAPIEPAPVPPALPAQPMALPAAELQQRIQAAHEAGDTAAVTDLIGRLPAPEQAVAKAQFNIAEPIAPAAPEAVPVPPLPDASGIVGKNTTPGTEVPPPAGKPNAPNEKTASTSTGEPAPTVAEPVKLIHYTSADNAASIAKNGFEIRKTKSVQGDAVYLLNDGVGDSVLSDDMKQGSTPVHVTLAPDAKILDLSADDYNGPSPTSGKKLKDYALAHGYDGVKDAAQTAIYNTSKIIVEGKGAPAAGAEGVTAKPTEPDHTAANRARAAESELTQDAKDEVYKTAWLATRRQRMGQELSAEDHAAIARADELDDVTAAKASAGSMKRNAEKQMAGLSNEPAVTATGAPLTRAERAERKRVEDQKIAEVDTKLKEHAAEIKNNNRQQALDALAEYDKNSTGGRESVRSAEDLANLADQLNKAGQAGAILRRGDYKSKKALGAFIRKGDGPTAKDPRIMLRDSIIKDPRMYATVLAHELSHAIEFNVNGNTKSTLKIFGELSPTENTQITNELKAIVDELEGADVAQANTKYFYNPTEMLARYVETMVLHPGKAELIAPLVSEKFGDLVVREPLVANLMAALDDSIDKGFKNYTPNFAKDLRQMYRKRLGKRVGDLAYDSEVIRRAEIQRSQKLIARLIKEKFKNIKDDPAKLFRAAEAVLVTEHEVPQFGTHDFADAFTPQEEADLQKAGWTKVGDTVHDGKEGFVYARERYTPTQAEQIFNELTPEGQQLIKDFTAAKEEAKDEFNRDLMKQLYGIDSKLEGWVHHYFDGKPMGNNAKTGLRTKIAAARKHRTGAEGYVEDFQKATAKALLELDAAHINNAFIAKQLARISKPIARGEKPEKGWVEVIADGKGGLRLPGEGGVVIIQSAGGSHKMPEKRYQVPEDLARHYREIREVPAEANKAAIVMNRMAKYWTINVLTHPGTTSTNFVSGGLQYGAKVMNDFYLDLLTANFGMDRTRHNLLAPLKVLMPRGWQEAPDWLYGGYRSTLAGSVASGNSDSKFDKGLDAYGNKVLKVFSLVETYWKKTIAVSESGKLSPANARRISDRLHKDEQDMVAHLNEAIDTYAFDYDNKPLWLSKFDRNGGKLAKPFLTYPYKLAKFYTSFAAAGFDKTLPWQQRVSKVLTLTTIVAMIAYMYQKREDEEQTPQGTEKTPLSLKPGGRLFVGTDNSGKEKFVRMAKYPFFNLTSLGQAAVKRSGSEALDLLNDQIGSVGPAVDLFNLATGRKDQFSQYTPAGTQVGQMAGSFIPGFRILNDIGNMIDPVGRSQKTFVQGVAAQLPIFGDEQTRETLRGAPRVMRIPDETPKPRSIAKSARTSTVRQVTTNPADTLLSLLTGVYVRRIDPKEAKKEQLRETRDDAEAAVRSLLTEGKESDAATEAHEHGLYIPDSVYSYYRGKRNKH